MGYQWLAAGRSPACTYYWTHRKPGADTSSPITTGVTDAGHGSEMNYIFDNLYGTGRPWTAEDYRIADTLSSYLVNFAATGNPNKSGHGSHEGRDLHDWPALRAAVPAVMEVGDAFRPIPVAGSDAKYAFSKKWLESQAVDW